MVADLKQNIALLRLVRRKGKEFEKLVKIFSDDEQYAEEEL